MTWIRYIVREMFRSLYQRPLVTLAAIVSLTLLLALAHLTWVGALTLGEVYRDLKSEVTMEVFLDDSFSNAATDSLQLQITAMGPVEMVTLVSKEMARDELTSQLGLDLLAEYDSLNPLPRSLRIEFLRDSVSVASLARVERLLQEKSDGSEVLYSKGWLERIEELGNRIAKAGFILAIVIATATLVTSTSSLSLVAQSRAVGIRQMRLLGASRFLIATPMMLQGGLVALIAVLLSWWLVSYGVMRLEITEYVVKFPLRNDQIIGAAMVVFIGALSGLLGLRSHLKESL